MCEDTKHLPGQAVARFRRQFGDQPTRAIHEVLAADVVAALVKEEVGSYRDGCIRH